MEVYWTGRDKGINVYKNNGSNMYEHANASAYVATIKKPSSEPLNPNPIQLTIITATVVFDQASCLTIKYTGINISTD